jgi:lipopolysaccharide transport system ATP-binding protein
MNSEVQTKNSDTRSSNDVVLTVDNVSKKFCRNLKRSMFYGTQDLAFNLAGVSISTANLRRAEFWAVDDVSFELRRGQVLGLVGPNGSGKTTLLRLLTGIFPPDKGSIAVRGRVGALIALGAGFHPHFTGRENIYLNGAILGVEKSKIDQRLDEIIDFAEIEEAIDAPVSTYSSGMRVRLGFSVAVQMEPDLLLVDEVLAVGDAGFRTKCINRISEMMDKAAVVFVSHAMDLVARVSTDVLLMEKGKIRYLGNEVGHGLELYLSNFLVPTRKTIGNGRAELREIHLYELSRPPMSSGANEPSIPFGARVRVEAEVITHAPATPFSLVVTVASGDGAHVCILYSRADGFFVDQAAGVHRLSVDFVNPCSPGRYTINFALVEKLGDQLQAGEVLMNCLNATSFISVGPRVVSHTGVQLEGEWGVSDV